MLFSCSKIGSGPSDGLPLGFFYGGEPSELSGLLVDGGHADPGPVGDLLGVSAGWFGLPNRMLLSGTHTIKRDQKKPLSWLSLNPLPLSSPQNFFSPPQK